MNEIPNRDPRDPYAEKSPAPFIIAGLTIIALVLGFVFMTPDNSERMNASSPAAGEPSPPMSSDTPMPMPRRNDMPMPSDQTQP